MLERLDHGNLGWEGLKFEGRFFTRGAGVELRWRRFTFTGLRFLLGVFGRGGGWRSVGGVDAGGFGGWGEGR